MNELDINYQCWICPICFDDHIRPEKNEDQWQYCHKSDLHNEIFKEGLKVSKLETELSFIKSALETSIKRANGKTTPFRLKQKTAFIWWDCPNECYCVQFTNDTISDFSFFDDAVSSLLSEDV